MENSDNDDCEKESLNYIISRGYLRGSHYIGEPKTCITSKEDNFVTRLNSNLCKVDIIRLNDASINIIEAEKQFDKLNEWLQKLPDKPCQEELMVIFVPLVFHAYFDCVGRNLKSASCRFIKKILLPLKIDKDWRPLLEEILTEQSENEQPLMREFRNMKCKAKLHLHSASMLRRFLEEFELKIIMKVLNNWFEIRIMIDGANIEESDEESVPSDFDVSDLNSDDLDTGSDSSLDSDDISSIQDSLPSMCPRILDSDDDDTQHRESYNSYDKKDSNLNSKNFDKKNEQNEDDVSLAELLKEINSMRVSRTPTAPLVLFSAKNFENVTCAKIDYNNKILVAGTMKSEILVGPLSSSFVNSRKLHPIYYNDVKFPAATSECLPPENGTNFWKLRGHCDSVHGLSFIDNFSYLLSTSLDTTMRLWDLRDFSCAAVYRGHSKPVWDVSVCNISNIVATASSDHTCKLWTMERPYPIRILAGHWKEVLCSDFHPNGKYVATGSTDTTVRLWTTCGGELVRIFGGHSEMGIVTSLAFSPNGSFLASAGYDDYVWIWDLGSGDLVIRLTFPQFRTNFSENLSVSSPEGSSKTASSFSEKSSKCTTFSEIDKPCTSFSLPASPVASCSYENPHSVPTPDILNFLNTNYDLDDHFKENLSNNNEDLVKENIEIETDDESDDEINVTNFFKDVKKSVICEPNESSILPIPYRPGMSITWSHDGSRVAAMRPKENLVYLWSLESEEDTCNPEIYYTDCSSLISLQYSPINSLVAFGFT